jgi:hypothetical protein
MEGCRIRAIAAARWLPEIRLSLPSGGAFYGRGPDPSGRARYVLRCSNRHVWWVDLAPDGTELARFAVLTKDETGGNTWSVVPLDPWTLEIALRGPSSPETRLIN